MHMPESLCTRFKYQVKYQALLISHNHQCDIVLCLCWLIQ
uniref:Uncharacterized protein n=1 Tax=Arundo donax TaxID=35708 RepID=A0A0A9GRW3_ARUDO